MRCCLFTLDHSDSFRHLDYVPHIPRLKFGKLSRGLRNDIPLLHGTADIGSYPEKWNSLMVTLINSYQGVPSQLVHPKLEISLDNGEFAMQMGLHWVALADG